MTLRDRLARPGMMRTLLVLAGLGAASLLAADYFNIPSWLERDGRRLARRAYLTVRPIRYGQEDVLEQVKRSLPQLADLDESEFWTRYHELRATGASHSWGHGAGAVVRDLSVRFPAVAAEIVARAERYSDDRVGPYADTTSRVGEDFSWTEYPPGDGDVIYLWEYNTLQHLPVLAQAHVITGDTRYAEAIARHLESWIHENPNSNSQNWVPAMEVSLRMISLGWTLQILLESDAGREMFPTLMTQLLGHARYVEDRVAQIRRLNNHAIFSALGMAYAAALLPEFESAAGWESFARGRLLEEFERQFVDGMHAERSPTYHKAIVDGLVHWAMMETALRGAPPEPLQALLPGLLTGLATVTGPDGHVALLGDSDDHRFAALSARHFTESATSIAVGRRALGGASGSGVSCTAEWEYSILAGGVDPEARCDEDEALRPAGIIHAGDFSRLSYGSWTVITDFGTPGISDVFEGHSHVNPLNWVAWHGEDEVVIDPGTYTYRQPIREGETNWRDLLRAAEAHNTFTPADMSYRPLGAFGLTGWYEAATTDELVDEDGLAVHGLAFVRGTSEPPTQRAVVVSGEWVAVVDYDPDTSTSSEARVQLADSAAELRGDTVLVNGAGLVLTSTAGTLRPALLSRSLEPWGGWRSREYGSLQAATTVRAPVRSGSEGTVVVTTLSAGPFPPVMITGVSGEGATVRVGTSTISLRRCGARTDEGCLSVDWRRQGVVETPDT